MVFQKNGLYLNDLDIALDHSIGLEKMCNSKVLITGASGTIASFIVDALLRYNQTANANIKIYVAGRDIARLKSLFDFWQDSNLSFLGYDNMTSFNFDEDIDYLIHAAGNAHPYAINNDPVGTIVGNVLGTFRLLEFFRIHGTRRFIFVSSGEVYGNFEREVNEYTEDTIGQLDLKSARSSYPESKRCVENMCASYAAQYGVDAVVVRLCHTFGPRITSNDSRANAQFFRNALLNEDIIMKSGGEQIRSYLYVADCVAAILSALLSGLENETYNVSSDAIKVSVLQFAETVAKAAEKQVIYVAPTAKDILNRSPIKKQVLKNDKIRSIGWVPYFSLEEGINHTLSILKTAEEDNMKG